jgi:hypothetical protein
VAVKVDSRVLLSERDRRRFVREVTAAGRLSGHPHVVDVYDAGTLNDGRPYMVMELCPAGSLDDAVSRHGPMTPAQVRDIGIRIADALAAAHAAGVLHRDIKPANILVNRYGVVGLSDFGLASILAAERKQSVTLEALTPAYAPPESFRGDEPAAAGDIYSLAATLYALLAGRPPRFPADGGSPSFAAIMSLHDKPVNDVPGAPPALMTTLRGSLATDPAVRPQSAVALRDALLGLDLAAPQTATLTAPPAQPHLVAAPAREDRPAALGRHARGNLPGGTMVLADVAAPPTDSLPGSVPAERAPASPATRRRRPVMRLTALVAGLLMVIGAAAVIGPRVFARSAQPTPHLAKVLYSFKDGTTDGWRAGTNVASVAAVTTFLDAPRHAYDGTYALDASSDDAAPVSAPRTMIVIPVKPLNLSAAQTFYLYEDGYGYPQVATGYVATVTLTSRNKTLSKTVPVLANTWNPVDIDVSSWPYRDHVTRIAVSFTALGSDIPWYSPHFQIDDVGYTT